MSYDIDLDFIGTEKKKEMEIKRPDIINKIKDISIEKGYVVKITLPSYIMERLELKYESTRHIRGIIKIEINFLNRMPLMPLQEKEFYNLFSHVIENFKITTYDLHELLAIKITTFLQRKKGRDLFDIFSILNLKSELDFQELKSLILLYLMMIPRGKLKKIIQNTRFENLSGELTNSLNTLDIDSLQKEISEEIPLNYPLEIDKMKTDIANMFLQIPPLTTNDKNMWNDFFLHNIFDPKHIIDGSNRINKKLSNHPSILRRIEQDFKK